MNTKKNGTNNQTKEEKVHKKFFKEYTLYLAAPFIAAIIIYSFIILRNQAETKTLADVKVVFEEEKSDIIEADGEFLAFKDYYENDPKTIYYLLPKDQLSSFPNASTYNEGKSFIISGKITYVEKDESSSYWKLVDEITILVLAEYNGILTYPQSDNGDSEYYSFKACSQEYSNCKYYLINKDNLSNDQLNFIDSLNENDEVKLSGEEKEIEGAAGSVYVELTEGIKIDSYSN